MSSYGSKNDKGDKKTSNRLTPSLLPRGGSHSKSTPNLPTLRTFNSGQSTGSCAIEEDAPIVAPTPTTGVVEASIDRSVAPTTLTSPSALTSPSEPASLEDFSLDPPSSIDLAASESDNDSDDDDDKYNYNGNGDDNNDAGMNNNDGQNESSNRNRRNNRRQDTDEDGDDVLPNNLPSTARETTYRPMFSRSSTYLGPPTFAPPFYNRPPTPLPPSPSLTSLLRPNFSSTATSRPGTPDPSSDEGGANTATTNTTTAGPTGAQTPNSAAATTLSSSFRTAKPIPRVSPKVPTYEYYGFTLYLTSSLAFLIYLLWSYLPSPFLHQLGIYYYPNRWWSLAIPAWLVMLVVWIFVALASVNTGRLTLPMKEVGCLIDDAACIAVVDAEGKIVRGDRSWVSAESANKRDQSTNRQSTHSTNRQNRAEKRTASNKYMERAAEVKQLDWRTLWNEYTDAVLDVPIGGVCEVLYSRHGDEGDVSDDEHADFIQIL